MYLFFVLLNENFSAISLSKNILQKISERLLKELQLSWEEIILTHYKISALRVFSLLYKKWLTDYWAFELARASICWLTLSLLAFLSPYINCSFSCTYQLFVSGSSSMWLKGWKTHYWYINIFSANYAMCFWGLILVFATHFE